MEPDPSARPERPLHPSQPPIRVFVSSVQDAALQPYRDVAVAAISSAWSFVPWAFEYTPAAAGPVQTGYLSQVRGATIVVWLVGDRTTEPVRREVAEALSAKRILLAFRTPSASRDTATADLIQTVQPHTKYVDVLDPQDLERHLKVALGDTIARALRQEPTPDRLHLLESRRRASIARMIEKWLAVDVPVAVAEQLALDPTVGAPADDHRPTDARPLVIIAAEIGSGKSLVAERMFGEALERAAASATAPIPIFVEGQGYGGDLQAKVRSQCAGLADPEHVGAMIVFDGADEANVGVGEILREIRILTRSWPNTVAAVTTRPAPDLEKAGELTSIEPLGEDEASTLMARLHPVGRAPFLYGWPDSVREAVKRPLFAALLSSAFAERDFHAPTSKGDLIATVTRRALARRGVPPDAEEALMALAVEATRRGTALLPPNQVGRERTLDQLWRSGILRERQGLIGFSLAIFQEWFAAKALLENLGPTGEQIVDDPEQLSRWREAITLAVATSSFPDITRILSPIARQRPAIASTVLHDATPSWGMDDSTAAPPWKESGSQIRSAAEAWIEGLGPLAPLVLPLGAGRRLKPIGISVDGAHVTAGWYRGADHPADVMHIEPTIEPNAYLTKFAPGWFRAGRSAAWPWRWTHEQARKRLDSYLKARNLPIPPGILLHEAAWRLALEVKDLGSLYARPIPIDELSRALADLPTDGTLRLRYQTHSARSLRLLDEFLGELRAAGKTTIDPPYIPPDADEQRNGHVWSFYTPEAAARHTRETHERALGAYNQLVEAWFPKMGPDLWLRRLQPFHFIGRVRLTSERHSGFDGGMDFYSLPLPRDKQTVFDIRHYAGGEEPERPGWNRFDEIDEAFAQYRPHEWRRAGVGSMTLPNPGPRPATNLAYGWLARDLKEVEWSDVTGIFEFD